MSKHFEVRWLTPDCMSMVECCLGTDLQRVYKVDDVRYIAFAGGWLTVFRAANGRNVVLRNWFTV